MRINLTAYFGDLKRCIPCTVVCNASFLIVKTNKQSKEENNACFNAFKKPFWANMAADDANLNQFLYI